MKIKEIISFGIIITLLGFVYSTSIILYIHQEWLMFTLLSLVPFVSFYTLYGMLSLSEYILKNIKEIKRLKRKERNEEENLILARQKAVIDGHTNFPTKWNYADLILLNKRKNEIIENLTRDIARKKDDKKTLDIEIKQLNAMLKELQHE